MLMKLLCHFQRCHLMKLYQVIVERDDGAVEHRAFHLLTIPYQWPFYNISREMKGCPWSLATISYLALDTRGHMYFPYKNPGNVHLM